MRSDRQGHEIAADVGGTFADRVMVDDRGGLWLEKFTSAPPDMTARLDDGNNVIMEFCE